MARKCNARWATVGFLSGIIASSAVYAEASWKLYDVRDLIAALPPAADSPEDKQPGKNVDDLLAQVCAVMALQCTHFLTGVYGVEAEDGDHARLQNMLEAVRDLYKERYVVELVLFDAPAAQAPAIGSEVQAAPAATGQRFVASRRTPTPVTAISRRTYLSGVEPVIAQNAVGYAPEKTTVDEGLDVSVLVGTNGDEPGGTSIEITGELRKATWPAGENELSTQDAVQMKLRFPRLDLRSIRCHLRLPQGKLVVVGVVAGFSEGQSVVIAASAQKL